MFLQRQNKMLKSHGGAYCNTTQRTINKNGAFRIQCVCQIMASLQSDGQGDLATQILHLLSENDQILTSDAFPTLKSVEIKSALDRLGSRSMITYDTIDREEVHLEDEGLEIAANGSHEARVFEALRQAMDGLTVAELEASVGDKNIAKVGQGKAFKSKWIAKGKDGRLVTSVSCKIRGQTH